ncbi:MAG: DUF4406 domain-containing protein [Oscillospiraceae bacterium]
MSDTIFLIVGESGSGKTTLVSELEKRYGLTSIKSYTTRPQRHKDEYGHIFVSDEEFDSLKDICAYTEFNNYKYGATSAQVDSNDLYIIDVDGIKYFRNNYKGNKKVCVIYISTSTIERYHRMIARGDSINKTTERIDHDKKAFMNILDYCDLVVSNEDLEDCIHTTIEFIRSKTTNTTRVTDNDFKSIIYVSHPYGGIKSNEDKIAVIIRQLEKQYPQNLFISPVHCFSWGYHETDYDVGISYCLWLLDKCDECWVYGDWENSKGCNIEVEYCKNYNIPCAIKTEEHN